MLKKDRENKYDLQGTADLHVHYFEDGNVQLRSTVHFESCKVSLDEVFQKIGKWECEIMSKIQNVHENMNDGILKSMRRVLPISKTKMEWNIQMHRMVNCLASK